MTKIRAVAEQSQVIADAVNYFDPKVADLKYDPQNPDHAAVIVVS